MWKRTSHSPVPLSSGQTAHLTFLLSPPLQAQPSISAASDMRPERVRKGSCPFMSMTPKGYATGQGDEGIPQELCNRKFIPCPLLAHSGCQIHSLLWTEILPSHYSSVSTKQPLPKPQAHFHTKSTSAASPKRPRKCFSSYNQPVKRVQPSTASRTEKNSTSSQHKQQWGSP